MHREARFIAKVELDNTHSNGSYVAPHVFEIDSLDQLTEEVFGPILHVIRYSSDQLGSVIKQINDTGYGLTLGIHSRIEAFSETVYRNTIAGNTYINRNMVGAVVGVNPFGGRGLSGTGPKAGGPNYLLRFSTSRTAKDSCKPYTINLPTSNNADSAIKKLVVQATTAAPQWQAKSIDNRLAILSQCNPAFITQLEPIARANLANPIELPGPTGEDNKLSLQGRGPMVLVVREEDAIEAAERQIVSALLCGCPVIVAADSAHQAALESLQGNYQQAGLAKTLLQLASIESLSGLIQNNSIEGLIANSLNTDSTDLRQVMAKRTGSIIPLIEWPETAEGFNYHWLLWFLSERTRTENLVARGGNTQLFNLEG